MKALTVHLLRWITFGRLDVCNECGRIVRARDLDDIWECCLDCYYAEDGPAQHWLCNCGEYIENGLHCPRCRAEPPWGCPCDMHDEADPEECYDPYEDYWPEDEP